jgi:hypothetical protein
LANKGETTMSIEELRQQVVDIASIPFSSEEIETMAAEARLRHDQFIRATVVLGKRWNKLWPEEEVRRELNRRFDGEGLT